MSREYGMEEIIGVLEEGFEPEFIASGLQIPIDYINQCKAHLEERKKLAEEKNNNNPEIIVKSTIKESKVDEQKLTQAKTIVKKMRDQYDKLLLGNVEEQKKLRGLNQTQKMLAESIKTRIYEAESLEEIKNIEPMISATENKGKLDFLNVLLRHKRAEIEQKEIMQKYRNNMKPEILQIVQSIINGKLDYEKAIRTIEEQAEQKVANQPKTKFTLTAQQEVQQTIIQIRKEIESNAKEYEIENPEKAVEALKQFDRKKPELAIKTVVGNLMARGKFLEAKNTCNLYIKNKDNELGQYVTSLRKKVRSNEVAKFVTEFLERDTTPEEEITFLEVLGEKIKRERIKISSVILGESKIGRRTITLANICGNEIPEIERN